MLLRQLKQPPLPWGTFRYSSKGVCGPGSEHLCWTRELMRQREIYTRAARGGATQHKLGGSTLAHTSSPPQGGGSRAQTAGGGEPICNWCCSTSPTRSGCRKLDPRHSFGVCSEPLHLFLSSFLPPHDPPPPTPTLWIIHECLLVCLLSWGHFRDRVPPIQRESPSQ